MAYWNGDMSDHNSYEIDGMTGHKYTFMDIYNIYIFTFCICDIDLVND